MDALLTCQYTNCHKFFLQPVMLPCSNNVCKCHIDLLIQQKLDHFTCSMCKNVHYIPANGYAFNQILANILSLNQHFNENEKKIFNLLAILKNNIPEIEAALNDPPAFIFEYIATIRNKIDLHREKLINEINSISNVMLEKLKNFEKECQENVTKPNSISQHQEYKNFLLRLKNDIDLVDDEMRTPHIEQTRLQELFEMINKVFKEIDERNISLKNNLLINNDCFFVESHSKFNHQLFGELKLEKSADIRIKLLNSTILTRIQWTDLIKLCNFNENCKFNLIYRASLDGFESRKFHKKCDGMPNTLTIIKVKGESNIFGGFCSQAWESSGGYKDDNKAFMFSLINKDNFPCKIEIRKTNRSYYSFYNSIEYGPTFGGGHDIHISNNSNTNYSSYSYFGYSYYVNSNYKADSTNARNFLAGSFRFMTDDIEVYQVV